MFSFSQITSFIIEKEKEILTFDRSPKELYEPIEYIMSLGGKKVRPALALMSYNLFGDNLEDVIHQALAVEVFHNFTLMHDDLMDNADVRRGKPSIHKVWNDNTAILSGDAMLTCAYQLVANCNLELLPSVLAHFSETAMDVFRGQQYDMMFEKQSSVSQAEYLEMIRLKTAVLLGCALKLGALIGGASDKDVHYLYDFGINLGLAFQLKDDLLDVYGDPKTFGKNIGGDILCNKKTYLLIAAFDNATPEQQTALEKWLSADPFDKEEKIKQVTLLYDQINVKALCEDKMNHFYNQAIQCLNALSVPEEKKIELQNLANLLMDRKS